MQPSIFKNGSNLAISEFNPASVQTDKNKVKKEDDFLK
jgi:hypothetical protein